MGQNGRVGKSWMRFVCGMVGIALIALIPATRAIGELVEADIDQTFASGGSGAPWIISPINTAMVDIAPSSAATSDPAPDGSDSVGARAAASPVISVLNNFTGIRQLSPTGEGFIYKPPDTHIAVGPGVGAAGRIVQVTNTGIQIFDKTGSAITATKDLDDFLTGLGATGLSALGVANLGFDPKVIFDQHSGRFFVVILDGRTPTVRSNVHIATSTTATPSSLNFIEWTTEVGSALTTIGVTDTWFDYPSIGADQTRLVVTGNMFTLGGGFRGTKIRVYLKSSLTDDRSPPGSTFNDINIDTLVTQGAGSIQPAHVFGSTLNGDFYCINRFGSTSYRTWQITGAGGSAFLATGSPTLVGWTAGLQVTEAPQILDGLNDEFMIATLSSRVMSAVYRNDAGNTDSIWACLSADTDFDGQTEVVWFEIDPNSSNFTIPGIGTTPTVIQSGSIDGSSAGSAAFMPSIAVNANGDAAICYSESSSLMAVEMRVATRQSGQLAGTFPNRLFIAAGAGEYDDFGSDNSRPERWGDYSACVVDPENDTVFWVANEVVETAVSPAGDDARWRTRIAQIGAFNAARHFMSYK